MPSVTQQQATERGRNPLAVERTTQDERGILVDPSPADIEIVERRVEHVIAQLAVQNISDIGSLSDVVVRDLVPELDLNSGADNGWTNENEWDQTGLTPDALNETYSLEHDDRAEDKVIAIFALSNVATSPSTTEVQFNNAQGGVFDILQTQGFLTDEEVLGLLNDPIISATSQRDLTIEQYVTSATDKLVFHGKVAEETGTTMGDNPSYFLSGLASRVAGGSGA